MLVFRKILSTYLMDGPLIHSLAHYLMSYFPGGA